MTPNTLTQLLSDLLTGFQLEHGVMSLERTKTQWIVQTQDLGGYSRFVFTEGFTYRQISLIDKKLKILKLPSYEETSLESNRTSQIAVTQALRIPSIEDELYRYLFKVQPLDSYTRLIGLGKDFEDED